MVYRQLSLAIGVDISEIRHGFAELRTGIQTLEKQSRSDKEEKILNWLSTFQHQKKHRDVCIQRVADTGEWLLGIPAFRNWCGNTQSERILCCQGIPGAGKTVISYVF